MSAKLALMRVTRLATMHQEPTHVNATLDTPSTQMDLPATVCTLMVATHQLLKVVATVVVIVVVVVVVVAVVVQI